MRSIKPALAAYMMLFTAAASADVPPAQKAEVEHLLAFVENASCTIIRNGKTHDSADAVSHIKKKYAYFKSKISSTEDFIELSATKSTLSGKYYMVSCGDGEQIKTRDWLLDELEEYRRNTGS